MSHTWELPGNYPIHYIRRSLAGTSLDLAGPLKLISGAPKALPLLQTTPSYSSGAANGDVWSSAPQQERETEEWSAVAWSDEAPMQALRIKTAGATLFPSTFRVEYSMDGGAKWLRIPAINLSSFPDPDGKTIEFPLHGLMGNAIRVVVPLLRKASSGDWQVQLGALQVVRGADPIYAWQGMSPEQQADWNNLWTIYGTSESEVDLLNDLWNSPDPRPFEGGKAGFGSSEWLDWDVLKFGFYDDKKFQKHVESALNQAVLGPDGYIWAAPNSPKHLGISRHYVTNACFIAGVADLFLINRDRAFLDTPDAHTGKTLLEKARGAMDFQLQQMKGGDGVLTILDPLTDGTAQGHADTYWDFWLDGYEGAYENVAFYRSLLRMKEMEAALGETARAQSLQQTADLVKEKYNETFWNPDKGRFISWIDKNGVRYDYGPLYINLPSVTEGLASPEHAKAIMSWVEGTRSVPGDDSTGSDLYHFKVTSRATTYDAAHGPPMFISYNGVLTVGPGGTAAFGVQMQNGGAIFYLSYYDLLARIAQSGPDNAWDRMQGILSEFEVDQLRRDPLGVRAFTEMVGIVGEFPESGLVPVSLLWGWLGLEPDAAGLTIHPQLPAAWQQVTVRRFTYAGKSGTITAQRGLTAASVTWDGNTFHLQVPVDQTCILTPDFKIQ